MFGSSWLLLHFALALRLWAAPAEDAPGDRRPALAVPVLGYLHDDAAGVLRPLVGIAGASLIGEPLALPSPIRLAAVSSDPPYALVAPGDGSGVKLFHLQPSGGILAPLPALGAEPERIILSPTASAAALINDTANLIEILTGLPDKPVLTRRMPARWAAAATLLALSDDGNLLLAAEGRTLAIHQAGAGIHTLGFDSPVSALALRPGSHQAALALAEDNLVLWLEELSPGAMRSQWGESEGIGAPQAVAFAADASRLIVANANGTLLVIELGGGRIERIACACRPTLLERLAGPALAFRLTPFSTAPIQLLTHGPEGLNVFFIPAVRDPEVIPNP